MTLPAWLVKADELYTKIAVLQAKLSCKKATALQEIKADMQLVFREANAHAEAEFKRGYEAGKEAAAKRIADVARGSSYSKDIQSYTHHKGGCHNG